MHNIEFVSLDRLNGWIVKDESIGENDIIVDTNLTEMNLDGNCDNNKCETNDVFTYVKLKNFLFFNCYLILPYI